MNFEIKWRQEFRGMFRMGVEVKYNRNGSIIFKNSYMTTGFGIITWRTDANYQQDRSFLQLPLLRKNFKYKLVIDAKSVPEKKYFFIMRFFDRNDKKVGMQVFKEGEVNEFTYPMDAYNYEIELINKNSKSIYFNKITIKNAG